VDLPEQMGLVHLADHNTNLAPLVSGPVIVLAPVHAKMRRGGYGAGAAG